MKRACVIGWPIAHSRSPMIHSYWLRKHGIDGAYTKIAVEPDRIESFLARLAEDGYAGCNVTVPHKQAAYRVAQARDRSADLVKAANTLWLERGLLCAANTDGTGFMMHLAATTPDWNRSGRPVVILGAGGAARAITGSFLDARVSEVRICNRTRDRADTLAADMSEGGEHISIYDWPDRGRACDDAAVIVNTTTLGMKGEGIIDVDLSRCADDAVVADIVYVPLETEFLRRARHRGLRTVDGLGMLLHQAAPGFEKWFGVRPEVTLELRALLARDIEGR